MPGRSRSSGRMCFSCPHGNPVRHKVRARFRTAFTAAHTSTPRQHAARWRALPQSELLTAEPIAPKRILILGGTGRVGSSTAASLLKLTPGHSVTLAGRSEESFRAAQARWRELSAASFERVDIADGDAVTHLASRHDIVVHTAGPFQRRTDLTVPRACLQARTPYVDVCDDAEHAAGVRALHGEAAAAGVACITTAGIYPGVSNVMAAHMCSQARKEYTEDGCGYRRPEAGEGIEPQRLLYSYFTAGTGGVGPTILETSLLLAGEPAVAFRGGTRHALAPVSQRRVVDFGPGLGRRALYLYNLPEVTSGHAVLRIPDVSARFGTSPEIWNVGMWLTARLAPKRLLEDRDKVRAFANFIGPLVRSVDGLAGEAIGMRVELRFEGGKEAVGLFVHKFTSEVVGTATAAFAEAVLRGDTDPGVWFPEEQGALRGAAARLRVMHRAAAGYSKPCFRFEVNKALWQLESDPKYLAMGMYL